LDVDWIHPWIGLDWWDDCDVFKKFLITAAPLMLFLSNYDYNCPGFTTIKSKH